MTTGVSVPDFAKQQQQETNGGKQTTKHKRELQQKQITTTTLDISLSYLEGLYRYHKERKQYKDNL